MSLQNLLKKNDLNNDLIKPTFVTPLTEIQTVSFQASTLQELSDELIRLLNQRPHLKSTFILQKSLALYFRDHCVSFEN